MTFEDLVKAETKRREIEQLTDQINAFLKAASFGARVNGTWGGVPADCIEPMRQAGVEAIAVKVIKLLEECRHLGIDVTSARDALAKVMGYTDEEQKRIEDEAKVNASIDEEIVELLGGSGP